MQPRDVGNEILVALATIGTLALALAFGLILTLSNSAPIPQPTVRVVDIATTIAAMTDVVAVPTIGNVYAPTVMTQPAPSATITNTATASVTASDTPPATHTGTPTVTNTAVSTVTVTETPTMPPTVIATSSATTAATPSDAPATDAATDADIVVVTGAATGNVTLAPTVCSPPPTWVPYVIQSGDTLFSIALQSNVTLATLQAANCIDNASSIRYGETIYLPPASALVQPTSTAGSQANGCANSGTRITSPRSGATLRGTITVSGTADIARFAFYKLEVRADGDSVWKNFAQNSTSVDNGALGSLNTALFSNGSYWLQLTVVDNTGNIPILPCAIKVRFTN